MSVCRSLALAVLAVSLAPQAAQAQRYQVEAVLPRVAQRGTLVDVVIYGVQLADPRELVFYRPGIRCTAVGPVTEIIGETGKAVKYGLAHGGRMDEQIRCRLQIADNCPVGEHPFHVRRGSVITVVNTINVTALPCLDENEFRLHSNDTLATATPIPLNVTVRGSIRQQTEQDVDLYKIPVIGSQRLSLELDMAQISDKHVGASEIDAAVRVLDETGKEIAAADDSGLHVQDPVLTFKAPSTGHVYIEVKQSTYTPINAAEYGLGGLPYSLHVGTFRRPLAAYPAGGPVGAPLQTRLLGDTDAGTPQAIAMPSEAGTFDYYGDAPSPLKLRACTFPNVLEDAKSPATNVMELPAALNGIVAVPGEADRFRLRVTKGNRLRVRVFASALGTPLDPRVRLRPVSSDGKVGEVETEVDDATLPERDIFGHYPRSGGGLKDVLDPSLVWTPKQDGEYELEISDTAGGGSPTSVYRVEIEPTTDGVACVLYNQGLYVCRGGRRVIRFRLEPMQGNAYAGPIQIVAKGLPAGVTFSSPPIPAGTSLPVIFWPGVLEASPDAATEAGLFELEAQAVSPSPPIRTSFQWKAPFINQTGGDSFHLVALEKLAVVVTDPAPFKVDVAVPAAALARNGELAIPVRITRRPDFKEAITIDAPWLPTGVGKAAALTVEDGTTEALLKISAASNANLGKWPLPVTASADPIPGQGQLESAARLGELIVAEPFVELASGLESVRRGQRKRYIWSVKCSESFQGSAVVKLSGLPKGVTQIGSPPNITRQTREVSFEIEATDDALLGPVSGVACEVVLTSGGQEIHQRSGNAVLRIDPRL